MKYKIKNGISLYKKEKPSDYIIEEWAKQKGMTIMEFKEWVENTPGYVNLKKFWKDLDKP